MSDDLTDVVAKIPLLTSTATPCDGDAFRERLKEELREVFKLKDVPCQTYLLMNGKKAGDGGESEVQAEDAVWREYEGWESICDDPLLKELVRESG